MSVVQSVASDGAVAARTWAQRGDSGGGGGSRIQRVLKSQPDSQAARISR